VRQEKESSSKKYGMQGMAQHPWNNRNHPAAFVPQWQPQSRVAAACPSWVSPSLPKSKPGTTEV